MPPFHLCPRYLLCLCPRFICAPIACSVHALSPQVCKPVGQNRTVLLGYQHVESALRAPARDGYRRLCAQASALVSLLCWKTECPCILCPACMQLLLDGCQWVYMIWVSAV
jgi:hypothetical protein